MDRVRVLILDDELQFREELASSLEFWLSGGVWVTGAATAAEACSLAEAAARPYDAFLIDQLLGPGEDGIAAMERLRQISPDTEAIILTAADDPAIGLRAYEAGVYHYLPKLAIAQEPRELAWIIQSLHAMQRLNEVTRRAQSALSFPDVAETIVQGGRQLGFDRARLWLVEDRNRLRGESIAGCLSRRDFRAVCLPASASPYLKRTADAADLLVFHGEDLGPGDLAGCPDCAPPQGDWVGIPLRAGDACLGLLMLDNVESARAIQPAERRRLHQFARQASAALERASLYQHEMMAGLHLREREAEVQRDILKTVLEHDASEAGVVGALLRAARQLLPDHQVSLLRREWQHGEEPGEDERELWMEYTLEPGGGVAHIGRPGLYDLLADLALRPGPGDGGHTGDAGYGADGEESPRGQVVLRIESADLARVDGAFAMRAPAGQSISYEQERILEGLAAVAGVALDSVRRHSRLMKVVDATRTIVEPLGLEATFAAIKKVVPDIAPDISLLTIWYRVPEQRRLCLGDYFGVRDEAGIQAEKASQGGNLQRVFTADSPELVERDAPAHSTFAAKECIQAYGGFPLRAEGESVGAMFFSYRHPHIFTEQEQTLFSTLADIVAASIRDAERLDSFHRQQARRIAAERIAEAVSTTIGLDQALQRIMDVLREAFRGAALCIFLYDAARRVLEVHPASFPYYRFDHVEQTRELTVDGPSIASRVARQAITDRQMACENISDVRGERDYVPGKGDTASELCVSLMSTEKQLLGVLILESPERGAFRDEDVEQARSIARQISIAIERERMAADLRFNLMVAAWTTWATDLAHDLSHDIEAIRTRADWLRTDIRARNPQAAQWRRWSLEIEDSARKIAHHARAEMPSLGMRPLERVHLRKWARWLTQSVAQRSGGRVAVEVAAQERGLSVLANYADLKRATRYLVDNALTHMNGEGKIAISLRRAGGQWIEIQVEDTGPGIPADVWPLLFRQAIRRGQDSGGLGLLFVRLLIEQMKGTIRALPPEPGRGAVFVLLLRLAPDVPGEAVSGEECTVS